METIEKKKGFVWQLLNPEGDVSSKRFGGVSLILSFIAVEVTSIFFELSNTSAELAKFGLVTGAGLLGVNVASEVVKAMKK